MQSLPGGPCGGSGRYIRFVTYLGLLTSVYGYTLTGTLRAWIDSGATSSMAMLVGVIVGQIVFGSLADILGRGRPMLCAIAGLQFVAFVGAALSQPFAETQGFLIACLFLLGLGIGGEYPVVAAQIVETLSSQASGLVAMRTLVGAYLCMGLGQVLAPLILLSCISWELRAEIVWTIAFTLGALFSVASLIIRWLYAKETPLFLEQKGDSTYGGRASSENVNDHTTRGVALLCKSLEHLCRPLLGTCLAACVFNFVTGGLFLHKQMASIVFANGDEKSNVQETLAVFIAASLSLPGFLLAPLVTRQKRRHWQLGGFVVTSAGLVALAIVAYDTQSRATCILYAMVLSLLPCSLGATVHFVPAEVFPTCVRATCIGFSMAFGELGSILALWLLRGLFDATSIQIVVFVLAGACFLGMLSTIGLTPLYDHRTLLATIRLRPGKDTRQITIEALDQAEPFRPCPHCEVMVERDGGCNVITCANCGEAWCFICGGRNCTAYSCASLAGANATPTIETLPQILWPNTS